MIKNLRSEDFRSRNGLSKELWDKSNCDWSLLVAIGTDHEKQFIHLQESAGLFAKVIQGLQHVHSVRWRVKNVEHLLAKIVRKMADGVEKYKEVSPDNYHQIVTDLVGIRALHLFKEECIDIDSQLRNLWTPRETPVVYIREGDQGELTNKFAKEGFDVKSHPAGYRSVHYVIESRPLNRSVFAELQVRTIFEEAWSEIDHRVRYPSFSQSELVAYFLAIFNRLSGSADEMGSFVRGLASTLQELDSRADRATTEKNEAMAAMERTLGEMAAVRQRDKESAEQIKRLTSELDRLKRSNLTNFPMSEVRTLSSLGGATGAISEIVKTTAAGKVATYVSVVEALSKLVIPSIHLDKATNSASSATALAKLSALNNAPASGNLTNGNDGQKTSHISKVGSDPPNSLAENNGE